MVHVKKDFTGVGYSFGIINRGRDYYQRMSHDIRTPINGIRGMVEIGSPLHLKRLLMNLLSNAVKYNKENGSVSLSCREVRQEGETAWIEFICANAGVGMSEEFQKHLSEPFTQENNDARSAFGGTGLGMSIAKPLDPQTMIRTLSKAIQDRTDR